jgi:hypothetical protein
MTMMMKNNTNTNLPLPFGGKIRNGICRPSLPALTALTGLHRVRKSVNRLDRSAQQKKEERKKKSATRAEEMEYFCTSCLMSVTSCLMSVRRQNFVSLFFVAVQGKEKERRKER